MQRLLHPEVTAEGITSSDANESKPAAAAAFFREQAPAEERPQGQACYNGLVLPLRRDKERAARSESPGLLKRRSWINGEGLETPGETAPTNGGFLAAPLAALAAVTLQKLPFPALVVKKKALGEKRLLDVSSMRTPTSGGFDGLQQDPEL